MHLEIASIERAICTCFPPPWSIEELGACFVYFENEPGRRSVAKLLTKGEARRIAANIAKLVELLAAKRAA
jgi:hypothetical protein